MSNKNQSWFDPVFVVQGRVYEGIEFSAPDVRGLFIRKNKWQQQKWLEANPRYWRRVDDVQKKVAFQQNRLEGPAEIIAARPSFPISSDIRKDNKDNDSLDRSPSRPPALAVERPATVATAGASGVEDEIAIGSGKYVSADRLASILNISRRTLSRRIAAGKVPSQITIGKKLYFEVSALNGLASDEFEQPLPSNKEVR